VIFAVAHLRHEQIPDPKAFEVQFDHHIISSHQFYTEGGWLKKRWLNPVANGKPTSRMVRCGFKTTDYGDDKDRKLACKSDGNSSLILCRMWRITSPRGSAAWLPGQRAIAGVGEPIIMARSAQVRAGLRRASGYGALLVTPDYVLHQMITVSGGRRRSVTRAGQLCDLLREL
jgi:hypothetical protein